MNNPLKYTDPSGYRFGPNPKDGNGVPYKNDMPGYAENGVYSFAPIYDNHGAIISFGFAGNNFTNTGFSYELVEVWEDTDGDGYDDTYVESKWKEQDNWSTDKGITVVTVQVFLVTEYERTMLTMNVKESIIWESETSYLESEISVAANGGGVDGMDVGGVLAVADVAIDGELRASHLLNAGMVGVSAIPVAGWIIGGGYLVADMITLGVSGQSIGQHLDAAVGVPLVNDIYDW